MEQLNQKLEKDYFFTKLELGNLPNTFVYMFIQFEYHLMNDKVDFPVGTVTLFKQDLKTTPIYTA